jgi:hypothetical protein
VADYLDNVLTADAYSAACSMGPAFGARSAVITVANASVRMQLAQGEPGAWAWSDREYLVPPQSFQVGNVVGVRFRSQVPGTPARILAILSGPSDPDWGSGLPFTQTLSASGETSSSGVAELDRQLVIVDQAGQTFTEAAPLTIVTFAPLTFDGATDVYVELAYGGITSNGSGGVNVWDGGSDQGRLLQGSGTFGVFRTILTPPAGATTYRLRLWANAGTTYTLRAGNGGAGAFRPMVARIVKAG